LLRSSGAVGEKRATISRELKWSQMTENTMMEATPVVKTILVVPWVQPSKSCTAPYAEV